MTLTSKTQPRATMEWHEAPANVVELAGLPSFRAIALGVGPIEVFLAVHMVSRPADAFSFGDHDRRLTIGAPAFWDDCVLGGDPDVDGELRVESAGYTGIGMVSLWA